MKASAITICSWLAILACCCSPVSGARKPGGGGGSGGGGSSSVSSGGTSSSSGSSGGYSGSLDRPSSSGFGSSGIGSGSPSRYYGGYGLYGRGPRYRKDRIRCSVSDRCDRDDSVSSGSFVCRTMYSPTSGDPREFPVCIDDRRAWSSDRCGCCEDECPDGVFVDLDCAASNVSVSVERSGGAPAFGGNDTVTICRDLYHPFTGEELATTLRVPEDKGLEGDTCGCCNDDCPEPGEQLKGFLRPPVENVTCSADKTIQCGDDDSGIFVCRKFFIPLTGEAERVSVCVPPTLGWENDECGCCEGECPDDPLLGSPVCDKEEHPDTDCELRNGGTGTFVCRGLFHPLDGQVRFRPLCVPNPWMLDLCGCCGDECPQTPANGFEDEATQLLMLALEDPSALEEVDPFDGSGGSFVSLGWAALGCTLSLFYSLWM